MKLYRSRRSILLGAFIWGILLVPLVVLLPIGQKEIVFFIIYSMILAFVAIIWFGIGYQIKDSLLWVMIGPICVHKVSIDEIKSVNRSYSPLSSPAASLKRMLVSYKGGEVLLSPKNEKQFIAHLKRTNPTIYCDISWQKENESIFIGFVHSLL